MAALNLESSLKCFGLFISTYTGQEATATATADNNKRVMPSKGPASQYG